MKASSSSSSSSSSKSLIALGVGLGAIGFYLLQKWYKPSVADEVRSKPEVEKFDVEQQTKIEDLNARLLATEKKLLILSKHCRVLAIGIMARMK